MHKVLVTGGAGFIGSHVVEELLNRQKNVVVVDNFRTGYKNNLLQNDKLKINKCDITNDEMLNEVFSNIQPDVVIHLAAQTHVSVSVEQPELDAMINIMGTVNVLNMCRKYAVKYFAHASSAAVYGDNSNLPLHEDEPSQFLSPYALSKKTAEQYVDLLGAIEGIPSTNLRFANVYGPRQHCSAESGVLTIFIDKLLKRERPTIFGDGMQTRDFIYVKDVATCVVNAVDNNLTGTYNVSTGTETHLLDAYNILCQCIDVSVEPSFAQPRKGDIFRSCLSNDKIFADIKWRPIVSLREGLSRTVDFYKST